MTNSSFHQTCTKCRAVRIGGLSKFDMLSEFQRHGIKLNAAARVLFAHEAFTISKHPSIIQTFEISVRHLGLPFGDSIAQILRDSARLGLFPCPLELGVHLRLQFLDQSEGSRLFPKSEHRAPPGSITVVSSELSSNADVPKGFYLRRIEGILWLRGYYSGAEHVWSPEDRLVFCC